MFTYFNENDFVVTGPSTSASIATTSGTTTQATKLAGKLTVNYFV